MKRQARNGDDFYGFLGLPFALPPIGAFRWQPPQAPPKWEGTLDATKQPNACTQDGIFKVSPVSYELFEFNLCFWHVTIPLGIVKFDEISKIEISNIT